MQRLNIVWNMIMNVIADDLSSAGQILSTEWSVHWNIVNKIFTQWSQLNLNLFAARYNIQCLIIVSPNPDSRALGMNAVVMDWEGCLPMLSLLNRS